jgi:hypothetical protein
LFNPGPSNVPVTPSRTVRSSTVRPEVFIPSVFRGVHDPRLPPVLVESDTSRTYDLFLFLF